MLGRSLSGLVCALLVSGMAASPASAQSVAIDGAVLRAALLVNFAKFVRWPKPGIAESAQPFAVCVHGDTTAVAALGAKAGTKVQGRPLQARSADDVESVRVCQVLFVGKAASTDSRRLSSAAAGSAVLVVSERAEDASLAAIMLVEVDGRVAFDVNLAAARWAGLEVDSQLLGIARHVTEVGVKAR